jgi:hypothetical protein
MANVPTQGVFLPAKLNACNFPTSTGAVDSTGTQVLPTGLTPYKVIELGFAEAQALQVAPPSVEQLFEGAYQWVQVDSGAVAAEVNAGLAAYYKLPNPAAPVTALTTITSESSVSPAASKSLFAGVFLNPITPGNWGFIFVGAGRVNATFKTTLGTNGAQGNTVVVGGGAGTFDGGSASTELATTIGLQTVAASGGGTSTIYCRELFYRIPG